MSLAKITIKAFTMDYVMSNPELDRIVRSFNLGGHAGMMTLYRSFHETRKTRSVDAMALVAYLGDSPVGWALYSKEPTNLSHTLFNPEDGVLFYIFIAKPYRRLGAGSKLIKAARDLADEETLCVCPWDERSSDFYFKNREVKLFNTLPDKRSNLGDNIQDYYY